MPVLDTHSPVEKAVLDSGNVAKTRLGVTADDLETLALNSNRLARSGRPPTVQLGHTSFEKDVPEAMLPRAIGYSDRFRVQEVDGTPQLISDIHILEDEYSDAMTYPRLSIERVDWSDPDRHRVSAVALIRREPERDLPTLPYAAIRSGMGQVACYARDFASASPSPSYATWLKGTGKVDTPRNRTQFDLIRQAIQASPSDPFSAFSRLRQADRNAFLNFCGRRHLRPGDPNSYRKFDEARSKGMT